MELSRPPGSERPPRRFSGPDSDFTSQTTIEAYLDGLNRRSPMAQREILGWGEGDAPRLQITSVPVAAAVRSDEPLFMAELHASFGLQVEAKRVADADAPFVLGLVLSGTMRVTLEHGEYETHAGSGAIIDPRQVARTEFSEGAHFIEFSLPKSKLLRLGAELAPGRLADTPEFEPVLPPPLAQRMLFMAGQMADLCRDGQPATGRGAMFERWMEMIALTLLHEHQAERAPREIAGPPPRSLTRALDFMHANAQADILLADIASAAAVSVRSLMRVFNEQVGQSPAAFLRQLRLDRARGELRHGWDGSIRELAQRWGFQSPGKFSQAYLRRFGERPRQGRTG